ncbi:MAG: RNA polymerase-binding protein DksA [Nitrospirae bacterium]|nr:RNA polymerase-binding protein DksA [Nitrospirota bacterium]
MATEKKGSTALKKTEGKYEEIRKDLEKQKAALLAEAGMVIGGNISQDKLNFPDMTDQAAAEADNNFTLRLKEREQKLLKKIDEALDRITDGTFGICDNCGEEIGYKRLLARPVTTYCIDCKTKQEEDEKLRE